MNLLTNPLTLECRNILSNYGWSSTIPGDFRDELSDMAELHEHEAGEKLYQAGDPRGKIIAVIDGWLNVYLVPRSAPPLLFHMSRKGAWGGDAAYLMSVNKPVGVSTITTCKIVHFPIDKFDAFVRTHPEFLMHLARQVASHIQLLQSAIVCSAESNSAIRVARTVLRLLGDGLVSGVGHEADPTDLPVRQIELAEMTTLSRNSVGSALKKLEAAGAINVLYRSIRVLDRNLLRSMS